MTYENKKLLDEVIKDRLETAKESKAEAEGNNAAFRQAMEAIDRQIEIDKIEASSEEQSKKQEHSKKETEINMWIQIGGLVASMIVVPTMQYLYNMQYAKKLCHFEKDYTFTTTPGKATSKFFNFGRKN